VEHRALLAEARRLEAEAHSLQRRLAVPTAGLGYRHLVEQVRAAVEEHVPAGERVLVVSRGDRDLLELGDVEGAHFPQGADGGYLGHHPPDSVVALAHLEELREKGAGFLVLPATADWWLGHYEELAARLRDRCEATELDFCTIYRLAPLRTSALEERVS
jgi:hypothetical protein